MRPRVLRRRLALAGFGAILAGAVLGTGVAKADAVDNYIAIHAANVCQLLDDAPRLTTVSGLFNAIETDTGWDTDTAARVIVASVGDYCPHNWPVLNRFVATYTDAGQVVA